MDSNFKKVNIMKIEAYTTFFKGEETNERCYNFSLLPSLTFSKEPYNHYYVLFHWFIFGLQITF